ncbi:hypothetical protein [Labrys neptuniae]
MQVKYLTVKNGIISLLLGSAVALCAPWPGAFAANTSTSYHKANAIPPRWQWEANYGYCGEVTFISAGLYYGQYVSQYDARAIASRNADQSKEGSQLLLGRNDAHAAAQMHLQTSEWKSSAANPQAFLTWVKEKVAAGYPVSMAVYKNARSFGESDNPDAGDPDYDHIVEVTGISSRHPLGAPAVYHGDDVITFSDNGLYSPGGKPAYVYHFPFGSSPASRREANSKAHPTYSLPRDGPNYGVAITGIIDRDGQALPIRLTTNVNAEKPVMVEGSNSRPAPRDLTLTVTVSGLEPGVPYNLYRYDSFEAVPNSAFNAGAAKASKTWKLNIKSGSSYSMTEKIKSNQTAVYRAVPETAP